VGLRWGKGVRAEDPLKANRSTEGQVLFLRNLYQQP
jgi:hypothetical protein